MFKTRIIHRAFRVDTRFFSSQATKVPSVWVVTDGGIESSLQAIALGKQLSGSSKPSSTFKIKTVVASKKLQMLPSIFQKYLIDWSAPKQKGALSKLPWYLTDKDGSFDDTRPDYVIASGQDAIPACLHLTRSDQTKKCFSVYLGYPSIPFINFDQVILPKYEANAKMAALGPLARQKNGIITPAPILDIGTNNDPALKSLDPLIPFNKGFTTVVVGGHSPNCRWYSEDAITLADNIKRMVKNLGDKVVVVYTDRTPQLVKDKMSQKLDDINSSVFIWDSTQHSSTEAKVDLYENMIHHCQRVVLTADLDYACAHAATKGKPVYVAFGGQCRSYLSHFYRWMYDAHLARKLRLERNKHSAKVEDAYSYLGEHAAWGNGSKVLQVKHTMGYVKNELEEIRAEKVTGKRRK